MLQLAPHTTLKGKPCLFNRYSPRQLPPNKTSLSKHHHSNNSSNNSEDADLSCYKNTTHNMGQTGHNLILKKNHPLDSLRHAHTSWD